LWMPCPQWLLPWSWQTWNTTWNTWHSRFGAFSLTLLFELL
jgi:hypothetical protein